MPFSLKDRIQLWLNFQPLFQVIYTSMKFSVSSAELLKQIQVASGAIGTNPVLPILEDFLFHVKGKILTISATDLETSVKTEMEIKADQNGSVAIPAKILNDTLKSLPYQQAIHF